MPRNVILFLIVLANLCHGARAVRSRMRSTVLRKTMEFTVVLPNSYDAEREKRFPVVYLLHCAGGSPENYIEDSHLERAVDSSGIIAVVPYDGSGYSWWIDSPLQKGSRLSSFLALELKQWIDSRYRTRADRGTTGIAGLSMGGFGAFHNLINHPTVYGAMFGAKSLVDLSRNSGQYGLAHVIGVVQTNQPYYDSFDIITNAPKLKGVEACIRFYSGPNDWFVAENRRLHRVLDSLGVTHTYFENGEQHYPVPPRTMLEIMLYFRTCFERATLIPNKNATGTNK